MISPLPGCNIPSGGNHRQIQHGTGFQPPEGTEAFVACAWDTRYTPSLSQRSRRIADSRKDPLEIQRSRIVVDCRRGVTVCRLRACYVNRGGIFARVAGKDSVERGIRRVCVWGCSCCMCTRARAIARTRRKSARARSSRNHASS